MRWEFDRENPVTANNNSPLLLGRHMAHLSESIVEQAALAWLESLDYTILSGLEIAPGKQLQSSAPRQTKKT